MVEMIFQRALDLLLPVLKLVLGDFTSMSWFGIVALVVGILRLHLKPLFTIFKSIAKMTPTPKDDEVLEVVEKSKLAKLFMFLLDWLASIKIKG